MTDYSRLTGEDLSRMLMEWGWTQRRLAEQIGYTEQCVHYWVYGKRAIPRLLWLYLFHLSEDERL